MQVIIRNGCVGERLIMSWAIICDSSCNLRTFEPKTPDCRFASVPLKVSVAGAEYTDDINLDVKALNQAVSLESAATSSSCPSAGEWAEEFRNGDKVIAITISSNLSGSHEAALMARNIVMDEYARRHNGQIEGKDIFVLDSKAAGGKLEVMVELLDRYLNSHSDCTFDDAVSYLTGLERNSMVLYSLSRYDNLVKNGRMPKLAGTIASKLNIRMLGTASPQGTIEIVGPTRGEKKTYRKIIETMGSDGYNGGMVYIDHVDNIDGAQALKMTILEQWPGAEIRIIPCGGLCSYYAEESGLIIGYEWDRTK